MFISLPLKEHHINWWSVWTSTPIKTSLFQKEHEKLMVDLDSQPEFDVFFFRFFWKMASKSTQPPPYMSGRLGLKWWVEWAAHAMECRLHPGREEEPEKEKGVDRNPTSRGTRKKKDFNFNFNLKTSFSIEIFQPRKKKDNPKVKSMPPCSSLFWSKDDEMFHQNPFLDPCWEDSAPSLENIGKYHFFRQRGNGQAGFWGVKFIEMISNLFLQVLPIFPGSWRKLCAIKTQQKNKNTKTHPNQSEAVNFQNGVKKYVNIPSEK